MNVSLPSRLPSRGFTLVEILVVAGVGSLVLLAVVLLNMYGFRSFASVANYVNLDSKSRTALDWMLRDIRQGTQVTGYQNTGATRWLEIANTNAVPMMTNRYTWDSGARTLTVKKNGQAATTYLTECDFWSFKLYQRSPGPGYSYVEITPGQPTECKLVSMTWNCSRKLLGRTNNTESVQSAEIVLRNKQY